MKRKITSLAKASVLTLVAGGLVSHADEAKSELGKCLGINQCKGQTACANAKGSCAGTNTCKGQGWLPLSKRECADKKGKYEALK